MSSSINNSLCKLLMLFLLNTATIAAETLCETEETERSLPSWFTNGGNFRPQVINSIAMPLFPEDNPGDDRIVYQLTYTLPNNSNNIPMKKILLANGLNAWGLEDGPNNFFLYDCPVNRCFMTTYSKEAATADAIIYKDNIYPFNITRPLYQIWILHYVKCPHETTYLNNSSLNIFNWTSSYRRDSEIVSPYQRWVYYDPVITENTIEIDYAAQKAKKIAWIVKDCNARNDRLQYARNLSQYIQVDIYGSCGDYSCLEKESNCFETLQKEYKFYLAFEKSNCKDYITDVFFNVLKHNIVPIAMGARASDYYAVAPYNSYIHVEDFANVEELATYLQLLDDNDKLYNSYFKWKNTGEFVKTYYFCRLCAMIHANSLRHRVSYYKDVQSWWRDGACTRSDWRNNNNDVEYRGNQKNKVSQQSKLSISLYIFNVIFLYLVLIDPIIMSHL